jgi:lipopolysaccharide export system protein LptA
MTGGRAIARFALVAAALISASAATPARAQAVNLGSGGSEPIEIVARDGIEWNREARQYIARGEARASQAGAESSAASQLGRPAYVSLSQHVFHGHIGPGGGR